MMERIRGLLARGEALASVARRDDLEVAVAALLVEAARMDDRFDDSERRAIEALLATRFDLSAAEARGLLDAAEQAVDHSTQLFRFTQKIADTLSPAERARIIEMLWEVAYADGVLSAQEDALIRRVAALVYVPDSERMGARRRVRQRLGLPD
jgi:uncharacterized tellurite resistance protein B-like protein